MFIYSFRAQTLKLYLSIFLSVLSVICVILFVPFNLENENISAVQANKNVEKNFKNISTTEQQVEFLKQFGWSVEKEPRNIEQITIPIKFDPIFEEYNALQIKEGLNLEKYKGKSVKKYTYLVTNHDFDGIVYAHVLIYKNRVIGGDISSAVTGGFMHSFTKSQL